MRIMQKKKSLKLWEAKNARLAAKNARRAHRIAQKNVPVSGAGSGETIGGAASK
jgi:hypothetical protein